MELLKLLSANEIVAQVVSFLVLFFLLRAFAWKRILALLDERRERIASEFKKIKDEKDAAGKMKADYEEKLRSLDDAARDRIQEAVLDGKKRADGIKKAAHEEAQKIIERAKADAGFERLKAKEELKGEVIDLVLSATEHLLGEKVTEEKDRRIVKDFIEEIDKVK